MSLSVNEVKETLLNSPTTRDMNLGFKLTSVIGHKKNCSGFIYNLDNGKVVYLDTSVGHNPHIKHNFMYRKAKNVFDYTGGNNLFADDTIELLAKIAKELS